MLKAGDHVLGFDLDNCNIADSYTLPKARRSEVAPSPDLLMTFRLPQDNLPEVVLVRKTYPNRKNRATKRKWKLRALRKEAGDKPLKKSEEAQEEQDYEQFMQVLFVLC